MIVIFWRKEGIKVKKTQDGVDKLMWLKDLETSVATTEIISPSLRQGDDVHYSE